MFQNLTYRLFAIILAALLWYIVQGEERLEINRKINVVVRRPSGMMIRGGPVWQKDATLVGTRALVGDFDRAPIRAYVTIGGSKPGTYRFRIGQEHVPGWDRRIRMTVHDPYLSVFMDNKVTRTVPVREYLRGVPAEGYIIEKSTVTPPTVEVTGLRSEVVRLQHILTDPIDIAGLSKSTRVEAGLQQRFSRTEPGQVRIFLQVGERKINKKFSAIPVEIEGNTTRVAFRPRKVDIVVQGTPGVLNFIRKKDLRAFLDVRGMARGRYDKLIQVKIPPDTVLIETFPEKAMVEVYGSF